MTVPARTRTGDGALAARLRRELEGEVLFDAASRGRYSTDASIYQVEPLGVAVPRNRQDVIRAVQIAADEGVPVLPRGGGTSQNGQTVNTALVLDTSKYLSGISDLDTKERTVRVEPGVVLDRLNAQLKPHGLLFPIDPSTSSRCTLGGMAGNNSCGGRSIRYGLTADNVRAIEAVTADGVERHYGPVPGNLMAGPDLDPRMTELVQKLREIAGREAAEIGERFPKVLRRVGGYNLDSVSPEGHNMARMLVGSEGTLAFFTGLELQLQPVPAEKVMGVCHFPTFRQGMEMAQHLVTLDPVAVELIDRTMIDLARDIPMFRPTVDQFVKGRPEALLIVEFAGDEQAPLLRKLRDLNAMMADHGFVHSVVEAVEPGFQAAISEVRKAGLNIMMSMKDARKPVSFIEDCAVPLEHLADYTSRLTELFEKNGTSGTWYAHASVGCLHVRPVLNMKDPVDVHRMREIAEAAMDLVREYKGSHSGEHGDGISRSEFHEKMFGTRLVRAFEEVKDGFDPSGLFNPGRITRAPKFDDRDLFRFKPGYAPERRETALDWSDWGGLGGAVEMCNNNGACRKFSPGAMCPSYRATRDEQHVTRGRANTLRLALSGQIGRAGLASEEVRDALDLCVSCKACRRECPTGVDMAKMKVEFRHHWTKKHGLKPRDWLVAYLPRYARWGTRLAPLLNLRDRVPGLPWLSETLFGLSARRPLPVWRRDAFPGLPEEEIAGDGRDVALFVDTFTRFFEPENARAAVRVLRAAGYRVHVPAAEAEHRPLCCGRTFLAAGLVDEARAEQERTLEALARYFDAGVPLVGLEPSCLFTFHDEVPSVFGSAVNATALRERTMLFETFLRREKEAGRLKLRLGETTTPKALVHGHCHQKAFAAMGDVTAALEMVPGMQPVVIESSCCGMAGAFGYEAEHVEASMAMGELSLLPAVRRADPEAIVVADGTSCRHQIRDGAGREAMHVARVLERHLM
ncbi:MAG: FAD-linked oxidase C-terminal domain-containing protein [Acetobacterales bacterium]